MESNLRICSHSRLRVSSWPRLRCLPVTCQRGGHRESIPWWPCAMSNWLRELWRKLRFFIYREQVERDLDEEMQLHKELRQEEYRNMGIDQDSAQHKANRQFGNVTLLKEVSREMWGWRSIENLLQDLRYCLRMLRRSHRFASAVL